MPRTRTIVTLLLTVFTLYGCATALPRLPSGGEDATNAPDDSKSFALSWHDSQDACRSPTLTARARVRGTRDRRPVDAAFWMGVDATTFRGGTNVATVRVRLESMDTRSPRFAFLGTHPFGPNGKDEATLLLSDGRWVVRARSRELVELVLGVPLSAPQLRSVLTGCPMMTGGLRIERFDADTLKFISQSGDAAIEVFTRRRGVGSPWAVFAMIGSVLGRPIRWRADLGERPHGVLESVRLTSLELNGDSGRQFDLNVSFDRIQTPVLAAEALSLPPSESAEPIPIDAVRSNLSLPLLAD